MREKPATSLGTGSCPSVGGGEGWPAKNVEEYERIKARADKVKYISQEYFQGRMHKRNRHLVDNSSVCICYLTKAKGGTAYTVGCAKEHGIRVINIA